MRYVGRVRNANKAFSHTLLEYSISIYAYTYTLEQNLQTPTLTRRRRSTILIFALWFLMFEFPLLSPIPYPLSPVFPGLSLSKSVFCLLCSVFWVVLGRNCYRRHSGLRTISGGMCCGFNRLPCMLAQLRLLGYQPIVNSSGSIPFWDGIWQVLFWPWIFFPAFWTGVPDGMFNPRFASRQIRFITGVRSDLFFLNLSAIVLVL